MGLVFCFEMGKKCSKMLSLNIPSHCESLIIKPCLNFDILAFSLARCACPPPIKNYLFYILVRLHLIQSGCGCRQMAFLS